jgi:hypothetical protein
MSKQKFRFEIPCLALLTGALLVFAPSSAFAVVLYAISGDGGTPPSSLFSLDPTSAAASAIGPLGNGGDGEGIAFRPDDGLLYHTSGNTDGFEFFETVNPDNAGTGPNLAPAGSYGPAAAVEVSAVGWYPALGVFLASDLNFDFFHISASGQFTLVGNSGVQMRGFAAVGNRVYAVNPFAAEMFEIDPGTGTILATLPLSVDGVPTTGNGLATHPTTGVVYAIVKDPAMPGGGRLLATLDLATGQATSVGNTGLKLAGIVFRTHEPLYAISGDGASPASTLYRLNPGSGTPTFAATLGNGDDGEGIAFRPEDGLLYHTSGANDGFEVLETIDQLSLGVGPNLAPGGSYGPDSAGEITAIAWYPPLDVFLACDGNFDCFHIAPDGTFSLVGSVGLRIRGFAVVGSRVYGVSPFAHALYEIDPNSGAVLDTLPLSVDGFGTTGNGLATSPDSGVVFAILKNPLSPAGGRLLARVDVATGQATSVGDTGHKLAGLRFGGPVPPKPPIATPALGPFGLAALAIAFIAAVRTRCRV